MNFVAGSRVCVRTVCDNGLPIVRYGTVSAVAASHGPLVVIFDDGLGGDIVDSSEVETVSITSIELFLDGVDLADDPDLRQGLCALWQAEAVLAGIEINAVYLLGAGLRDSNDTWALAEVHSGGDTYVVRVHTDPNAAHTVTLRADPPRRWDY
ncbi:MAG: hypothetical protein EXQ63_08275 [Ilumatobacteraceae bacterium]|nr:hypothetical protein [Ilumatobacteraceae bacterium]